MHHNSVLALRQRELALNTREFRARGSKVIRCEQCLLAQTNCICSARPKVKSQSAFCFIMYKGEAYKPSNTGRLIADVVTDNYAFLWSRTSPDLQLLDLLENKKYVPVLIFPHEYAASERCIHTLTALPNIVAEKSLLFIMLDGTWREAKKMFRSSYLADLPVLGIKPIQTSTYLMRDAAHLHQLCTAEVAIEVLALAGDNDAANALQTYFSLFCESYMIIKPHLLNKIRE